MALLLMSKNAAMGLGIFPPQWDAEKWKCCNPYCKKILMEMDVRCGYIRTRCKYCGAWNDREFGTPTEVSDGGD